MTDKVRREKCGKDSGALNCGCCEYVSVLCNRKPRHKGKCRGKFYGWVISWKAKND